ncbi:hypothetical protein B0H19DRAFT_1068470 [Mycena capillaripes]|nr:hypothetical protein B0H19DRAFT_1068470 [Mycena capillaripes]
MISNWSPSHATILRMMWRIILSSQYQLIFTDGWTNAFPDRVVAKPRIRARRRQEVVGRSARGMGGQRAEGCTVTSQSGPDRRERCRRRRPKARTKLHIEGQGVLSARTPSIELPLSSWAGCDGDEEVTIVRATASLAFNISVAVVAGVRDDEIEWGAKGSKCLKDERRARGGPPFAVVLMISMSVEGGGVKTAAPRGEGCDDDGPGFCFPVGRTKGASVVIGGCVRERAKRGGREEKEEEKQDKRDVTDGHRGAAGSSARPDVDHSLPLLLDTLLAVRKNAPLSTPPANVSSLAHRPRSAPLFGRGQATRQRRKAVTPPHPARLSPIPSSEKVMSMNGYAVHISRPDLHAALQSHVPQRRRGRGTAKKSTPGLLDTSLVRAASSIRMRTRGRSLNEGNMLFLPPLTLKSPQSSKHLNGNKEKERRQQSSSVPHVLAPRHATRPREEVGTNADARPPRAPARSRHSYPNAEEEGGGRYKGAFLLNNRLVGAQASERERGDVATARIPRPSSTGGPHSPRST